MYPSHTSLHLKSALCLPQVSNPKSEDRECLPSSPPPQEVSVTPITIPSLTLHPVTMYLSHTSSLCRKSSLCLPQVSNPKSGDCECLPSSPPPQEVLVTPITIPSSTLHPVTMYPSQTSLPLHRKSLSVSLEVPSPKSGGCGEHEYPSRSP